MKTKLFLWLLFFLLINYFLSSVYRPYVFKNNLNDFGLADIGNNIIFIPGVYLALYLIYGRFIISPIKDIYLHFFILTIIEILSYFIEGIGTYDVKDIIGLFLGSLITIVLSKKNFKDEKIK